MLHLLLLLSSFANANDATNIYYKYGVGIANSAKRTLGEVKTVAIGHQDRYRIFVLQSEIGFIADNTKDNGRKSTGYLFYSGGLHISAGLLEVQSLWGIGFITTPDSYLGGRFPQFKQDLFLGFKGLLLPSGEIGVDYGHISSAGLVNPNQGRDLLTIKVGINF